MPTPAIEVLVTTAPGVQPGDPEDPFRYGWRYVRRVNEHGAVVFEQVPLTLEDLLHPQEGDQVIHTEAHQRRCVYLYDVFRAQLAADPTAVVLQDVRVAWDVPNLRPHGPDIAVILGVRQPRNWGTFNVTVEGVRPELIVEVTSPETARQDRVTKRRHYALARVPLYVIVDMAPQRGQPPLRLLGYTWTPEGYELLATDEHGRLRLAPLRISLGVVDNELVCYDGSGQPLGDYGAQVAARAEAERQVAAERQARTAAETRLRELEAELRRLRGETE